VTDESPILLSAPDVGKAERDAILRAFDGGWIAPAGPELDIFESELCEYTGAEACVALSSGTAALHLALLAAGVQPGQDVVVQSATFAASAFAVVHTGAAPVFMDSEWDTWCLDPTILRAFLVGRAGEGSLPAAVMPVDLYGSTANYAALLEVCAEFGVPLVRDAAEALGSISTTGAVGETGSPTALSFNGNKIITTSGGGALLADQETVERCRYLATQARQPTLQYEHREIGYNYRLSNLLAAVGRAQLATIEEKVERRRSILASYRDALPEIEWCPYGQTPRPNAWLSVGLLPVGTSPIDVCETLKEAGIEARPAWKPMHQQEVFSQSEFVAGFGVADELYERGICLPSGSSLTDQEVERVISSLLRTLEPVRR